MSMQQGRPPLAPKVVGKRASKENNQGLLASPHPCRGSRAGAASPALYAVAARYARIFATCSMRLRLLAPPSVSRASALRE